jgi:hypothetical protein
MLSAITEALDSRVCKRDNDHKHQNYSLVHLTSDVALPGQSREAKIEEGAAVPGPAQHRERNVCSGWKGDVDSLRCSP